MLERRIRICGYLFHFYQKLIGISIGKYNTNLKYQEVIPMNTCYDMQSLELVRRIVEHWRNIVSCRRYDTWCEINNEEVDEIEFARENHMDTIHWCWNCKYGDCDQH